MSSGLVHVFEGTNVEANVVAARLEAEGLHPVLRGCDRGSVLVTPDSGTVAVLANEAEEAMRVIAEVKMSGRASEEDARDCGRD